MSGEFEFSHGQVVMLENYYSHVGCVPDDSLLEKLTAAVIRMDKANAGVTQDNVREWFEKREGTPPIESKDKDKDKEKEKENLEQPRDDLPLQEGAPLKQNRDNLRTMLSCHASTSSLPISSSHLHTQRPPRQREGSLQAEPGGYQNSLMQMASTRKEGLDLELEESESPRNETKGKTPDGPPRRFSASADKIRSRSRTISSGNLKNILSRSVGSASSSSLSRTSSKAQSARELNTTIRDEVSLFVSRPRVHAEWPTPTREGGDKNNRDNLVVCDFDTEKWDVEVGGLAGGLGGGAELREEELFEESDNYPFYKQEFISHPHVTFGGSSESHGPVVVSMKPAPQQIIRESPLVSHGFIRGAAFVIVRTIVRDERLVIPFKESSFTTSSTKKSLLKAFRKQCPQYDDVNFRKLSGGGGAGGGGGAALEKALMDFERHYITSTFKFGVLVAKPGQSETEMFCNSETSPEFEEFLSFLGDKVKLEGFERFRGGLDVKSNTTGTHSFFGDYKGIEIMYHVSTYLPFDKVNEQQLERKRHLGNDVCVLIYLDVDPKEEIDLTAKFRPDDMCSQVNQVFIVCRPTISPRTGRKALLVNFVNKKGVPLYHPLLPSPPIFEWDEDDRMVLLLKMINAERAAMCAPVYRTKLRRTRRQMLQNIVDSYQESS